MNKGELIEKIKAVKNLAERGVGGEAENAEALLTRLMKKYGISEGDLSSETREGREFAFHGAEEEKLLRQIVYKVTNGGKAYGFRYTDTGRKCRKSLGAECTAAEKVEIEFLFDFYKNLWEREKAALLGAFIQKHKLFAIRSDIEPTILSDEEIEKMYALMNGLSNESPNRAIEAPKKEAPPV